MSMSPEEKLALFAGIECEINREKFLEVDDDFDGNIRQYWELDRCVAKTCKDIRFKQSRVWSIESPEKCIAYYKWHLKKSTLTNHELSEEECNELLVAANVWPDAKEDTWAERQHWRKECADHELAKAKEAAAKEAAATEPPAKKPRSRKESGESTPVGNNAQMTQLMSALSNQLANAGIPADSSGSVSSGSGNVQGLQGIASMAHAALADVQGAELGLALNTCQQQNLCMFPVSTLLLLRDHIRRVKGCIDSSMVALVHPLRVLKAEQAVVLEAETVVQRLIDEAAQV
jgi:hypothetical protein